VSNVVHRIRSGIFGTDAPLALDLSDRHHLSFAAVSKVRSQGCCRLLGFVSVIQSNSLCSKGYTGACIGVMLI